MAPVKLQLHSPAPSSAAIEPLKTSSKKKRRRKSSIGSICSLFPNKNWASVFASEDDDDDYDTEASDESGYDSSEENARIKQLVEAAFARKNLSDSALTELTEGEPIRKKSRTEHTASSALLTSSMNNSTFKDTRRPSLRLIDSVPDMRLLSTIQETKKEPSKEPVQSPQDCLLSILKSQGASTKTFAYDSISSFFVPVSPESISHYDMTIVKATRNQDVETLRQLHSEGRNLQCANKFGESIVHTACRRGSMVVLDFLLQQGVSLQVCCDYGRTPLHDACWTSSPNLDVIKRLLQDCPDLLYVTDKRGFCPLDYVPKTQWAEFGTFLKGLPLDHLKAQTLA